MDMNCEHTGSNSHSPINKSYISSLSSGTSRANESSLLTGFISPNGSMMTNNLMLNSYFFEGEKDTPVSIDNTSSSRSRIIDVDNDTIKEQEKDSFTLIASINSRDFHNDEHSINDGTGFPTTSQVNIDNETYSDDDSSFLRRRSLDFPLSMDKPNESIVPNESSTSSRIPQRFNQADNDTERNSTIISPQVLKSISINNYNPSTPLTIPVDSPAIIKRIHKNDDNHWFKLKPSPSNNRDKGFSKESNQVLMNDLHSQDVGDLMTLSSMYLSTPNSINKTGTSSLVNSSSCALELNDTMTTDSHMKHLILDVNDHQDTSYAKNQSTNSCLPSPFNLSIDRTNTGSMIITPQKLILQSISENNISSDVSELTLSSPNIDDDNNILFSKNGTNKPTIAWFGYQDDPQPGQRYELSLFNQTNGIVTVIFSHEQSSSREVQFNVTPKETSMQPNEKSTFIITLCSWMNAGSFEKSLFVTLSDEYGTCEQFSVSLAATIVKPPQLQADKVSLHWHYGGSRKMMRLRNDGDQIVSITAEIIEDTDDSMEQLNIFEIDGFKEGIIRPGENIYVWVKCNLVEKKYLTYNRTIRYHQARLILNAIPSVNDAHVQDNQTREYANVLQPRIFEIDLTVGSKNDEMNLDSSRNNSIDVNFEDKESIQQKVITSQLFGKEQSINSVDISSYQPESSKDQYRATL